VNLFVDNVEKNIEYFTRVLGFTEVERMEANGEVVHGLVAFGRGANTFGVGFAPTSILTSNEMDYDFGTFGRNIQNSPETLGNGVFLHLTVPDVDAYYAKIKKNGADIDEPPTDQAWGERTISVLTPDGYYITFATATKGWTPDEDSGFTIVRGGKRTGTRGATRGTRGSTRTTRAKRR
jgi:uncharacterized glyoxalase superfamily protein PhnB